MGAANGPGMLDGVDPLQAAGPAPAEDSELLRQFVAARNVPCPGCGYNLRGMTSARCPECGTAVRLVLIDAAREGGAGRGGLGRWGVGGHWMFLLLAFGWLLVAGSMNTTRNIQQIWWQLEAAQFQVQVRYGGTAGNVGGPVQITRTPAAAGSPVWSSVDWLSWARVAWSGTLAIGASLGFLLMYLARRRALLGAATEEVGVRAPGRRLVVYAWLLFAVYAGWHAWMFTGEMIG